MKKENTSFKFLKMLAKVFKPTDSSKKNSKPKPRQPSWMYRNE